VDARARFEALYRAHAGAVRAYAGRRSDARSADDVVADAKSLIEQSGARYVGASIVVDQLPGANRQALGPCHALIAADELG